VEVAADLGFEAGEQEDVFVGLLLEEVAAGLEAEEDAIEQIPALRVAMRGDEARGFQERCRGVRVGNRWTGGRLVGFEREGEWEGNGCVLEVELAGVESGVESVAGDAAPGFQARGDRDVLHCWMRWREAALRPLGRMEAGGEWGTGVWPPALISGAILIASSPMFSGASL
jgi:hypothetical protein